VRRTKRISLALVAAALGAAAAFGAAVLSRRPVQLGLVELGPGDSRLRPCPDSPNCVRSEPGSGAATLPPLAFSCDPDRAFASIVSFLEDQPRVELLEVGRSYLHAVCYTPLLRFADDLELRLDREAGVIHVRSASRVGHSDLGANRARVEDLRARWRPPRAALR